MTPAFKGGFKKQETALAVSLPASWQPFACYFGSGVFLFLHGERSAATVSTGFGGTTITGGRERMVERRPIENRGQDSDGVRAVPRLPSPLADEMKNVVNQITALAAAKATAAATAANIGIKNIEISTGRLVFRCWG
ncbi:hypothetical protein PGB90_005591 [Kerria lacca]